LINIVRARLKTIGESQLELARPAAMQEPRRIANAAVKDEDARLTPQRATRLLWSASVLFAVCVFAVSWWRWWTFAYTTFDLAFYVQSLWLALRGEWMVSLLNVPMLGNHAEPIVFLALPLFAIWSHPMLFVALQSAAIATLPLTAWRIARKLEIETNAAFLLALAAVLTPATGFVALHEFHPEALAAPLLLLLIEARITQRRLQFWLSFLALLACKENLALLLTGWCLVHGVIDWPRGRRWQIQWNVAPLAVAAAWFALYAFVISPALNKGNVDYLELYSHLGRSPREIVQNFFHQPQVALQAMRNAVTHGNLVWALLVPFLALPLWKPRWLLLTTPVLIPHLLSWRVSEWSIEAHYGAPFIPLLWMGTAMAVASFRFQTRWACAVFTGCLITQAALGPVRGCVDDLFAARERLWERRAKAELLSMVPREASVTAGLPYLSHLATRRELFSLHHVLKGLKTLSRKEYRVPLSDVVLVDYDDTATFNVPAGYYHPLMRYHPEIATNDVRILPSSDRLLHDYLREGPWKVRAIDSVRLYVRGENNAEFEFEPSPLPVAPGLELLGFEEVRGDQSIDFRFAWRFSGDRDRFPWLILVARGDEREFVHRMGACAIAAADGTTFEQWTAHFPPEQPLDQLRLSLLFYEHNVAAWQNALPPADRRYAFREIMLGPAAGQGGPPSR